MQEDTAAQEGVQDGPAKKPGSVRLYDSSHDALALELGCEWHGKAQYVALWGQWLFWDGSRWEADTTLKHMNRAREFLRNKGKKIVQEAVERAYPNEKEREYAIKDARSYASFLRQKPTIAAVVDLARSNTGIAASVEQWDAGPWLLGTPAGTVDLRTGILHEAIPADYITKLTAVAPAPPGTIPTRWLKFLDRITAGDKDLQAYLQRWFGYGLTGSIREHALGFGHGEGANGKSVFVETLKRLLLDYACTIGTETLMVSHGDRHPTELARLRGVRLAIGSETEEGKLFAESKLKSLTGGDTIMGRFMRQDFFEFEPQFKLFIVGNHKPGLRTVDEAMRRRLHLVPFDVTIPPAERDKDLAEKLEAEWPAILRWAIDGCIAWQGQGLNPPECVRAATEEYLSSADTFSAWRSECTVADRVAWASNAALWASWEDWAEDNGAFVGKAQTFWDRLAATGFVKAKQSGVRGYQGLRVKPGLIVANGAGVRVEVAA
jgi:putative DNA primase/helicase